MDTRTRVRRALKRARYAAMGAAVGAAIGGLFSRSTASTGGATGAFVGAAIAEKRYTPGGWFSATEVEPERGDEMEGMVERVKQRGETFTRSA